MDDVITRLHEAGGPGDGRGIDPWAIAAQGRRRRRARRSTVGAVVAVALAGGGVALGSLGGRPAAIGPATPPPYLIVRGQEPLACGSLGPLSLLSAEPGAENADTPEARGLREVFAHDPTGGESPQTPHGWVLLQRKGDLVTFGQRQGAVGVLATVTLRRKGSAYVFDGSGGCGPIGYADGRTAIPVGPYTDRGDHLEVSGSSTTCGDTRVPSVVVHETATEVDILALNQVPVVAKPGQVFGCGGRLGLPPLIVPLAGPLAGRRVLDASRYPAEPLLSQAQSEARQARDTADSETVARLCAALGGARHQVVSVSYVTDAATVRAGVPAARVAWAGLDGFALAADCWFTVRGQGPGVRVVVDAAAGVPPVVRDPHHVTPLAERLPAVPGHPDRQL